MTKSVKFWKYIQRTKQKFQQSKLRKVYNESESPFNKITIDDRDFILLDIASSIIKDNKSNTKVKIYELKEVISNVINYLHYTNENQVLKQFFDEIYINTKTQIKMLNEMNQKQSIIPVIKKYKNCLLDFEEQFIQMIEDFNKNIHLIHIQGKDKKSISLYQAIFLYLFHKDIYKKEISDLYSIPTIIKINSK